VIARPQVFLGLGIREDHDARVGMYLTDRQRRDLRADRMGVLSTRGEAIDDRHVARPINTEITANSIEGIAYPGRGRTISPAVRNFLTNLFLIGLGVSAARKRKVTARKIRVSYP
jgi:hypothetical protein